MRNCTSVGPICLATRRRAYHPSNTSDASLGWFISKRGLSTQTAGQTYSAFLHQVAEEISELDVDVARLGHSLSEVSKLVHGSGGSLVKLVDEYYWVTITDGHALPTRDDLEQWLRWIIQ